MQLADKLQMYRKQRGMSQENLADRIGVSRQAVSKWESGQSSPELDKMVALSRLFGVSVDALLKEEEAGTAEQAAPASPDGFVRQPVPETGPGMPYSSWGPSFHYEYKSRRTWFGVPLVHVNLGRGIRVAKGIVAVGTVSVGVISVGVVALGALCFGALALGLISLAGLAAGVLLGAGGIAAGTVAFGGLAVGVIAAGGLAVGLFSVGGCAIASHIAIGGYASGHIAIGDTARGAYALMPGDGNWSTIPADEVRALIEREYPRLWKPLARALTGLFR
ncbi:helix-turn-helix transcriptional regulator [Paenibacillus spiritus]|uniref:Helix-turn-helix transcriptional regulator n=1 Tax=Paenibacillus spiritus TaxID=2496557 RepID=A0A5J5FXE7_9BACL|nr:helix-turn-helix transcriptional regulator [Paenibacillus spiritus]KAA8998804.1 helix-turn-helix transcriptional regulator [Paenibacillus spiritus]